MKILLVGNHFHDQNYNQNAWQELAAQLRKTDKQVITTSNKTGKVLRLADMLWTIWSHRKDYQVAQVDIFSGQAFVWAYMSGWLLNQLGKPFILTLRGGNLPNFASHWPVWVKHLLRHAEVVTAPSRYLQEEMRSYRDDIVLLPNPLKIRNYPFRLRATLAPRLVWLRAFHNVYHPQMAPFVIANLRVSYPEISLTMIGPDKGDGALKEMQGMIEELGLHKNIEIVPGISKSEVPAYLERADIFINTTNIDNTPVSVLEAMACGLCVVSTNVGGIPYLLQHEQDALLVPPRDTDAMTDAVLRLLREPKLAERLSNNARCKTEQFDWSVIMPRWDQLFEEIIAHA